MTSSPPVGAAHFRGKTLSPESPVPVYLPEPQNIPVLQNQTDPVFNLMSTHMEKPIPQDQAGSMHTTPDDHIAGIISLGQGRNDIRTGDAGGDLSDEHDSGVGGRETGASTTQEHQNWQGINEPDKLHNQLTYNAQPSVSFGAHESPSVTVQPDDPPSAQSQSQHEVEEKSEQYGLYRQVPEYATPRPDTSPTAAAATTAEPNLPSQTASLGANDEGVSYQEVLDNQNPSAFLPPTSDNGTANTATGPQPFSPRSAQPPLAALPIPVGLPARPPPQDKPAIHPNYTPGEDIRSYHNPTALNANPSPSSHTSQPITSYRPAQNYPPQNDAAPNGMAPPPLATFQQPLNNVNQTQRSPQISSPQQRELYEVNLGRSNKLYLEGDSGHPRLPEVERAYDGFLRDEANYTSQGQWEKFPPGSRLFVGKSFDLCRAVWLLTDAGNLFTEKVSKRDLFYIFYKYGRLAQISMKSAYGFVQYVQAEDCYRAMQIEQGLHIRGRKINLEISKPQKNTRNAATAASAGENLRTAFARRSRSPDYSRGANMRGQGPDSRPGADRLDRGPGYDRIQPRSRDDYRPLRSPSPRGMRGRDSYRGGRDRTPDRYFVGRRSRSRSPVTRGGGFRDRSPRPRAPDDEAGLPIARRPPGSAPDIQIILAEEVDRTFVSYIQQSFRNRSLRCEVLQLPHASMIAVVKRQILEGVQAVVKIFRRSQVTGKIPLQVYNRSQGLNDVQFDDYEDLDANIAAEIVVRAKLTHVAPLQTAPLHPPALPYGVPQFHQPQQTVLSQHGGPPQHMPLHQQPLQQSQAGVVPPNVSNFIGTLDSQALQKLLASMSQNPQSPQAPQEHQVQIQHGHNPDLSAILSSVGQQQGPSHQGLPHQRPSYQGPTHQDFAPHGFPQLGFPAYGGPPKQQHPQQNQEAHHPNFQHNAGSRLPQPDMLQPQQQQQQQQQQQPNVQEIMAQLARYRQ